MASSVAALHTTEVMNLNADRGCNAFCHPARRYQQH